VNVTPGWTSESHPAQLRRVTCPGSGQRTRRPYPGDDEPDRCPVCDRVAYVRLDGTTGVHYR
jgi:hypothetical protein